MRMLAVVVLSGCAAVGTRGDLQFVGSSHELTPNQFKPNPEFRLPAQFTVTPAEVHRLYWPGCRGRYLCEYFADEERYYLVQNWSVQFRVPWATIPDSASVIVDGRTGEVIKQGNRNEDLPLQ